MSQEASDVAAGLRRHNGDRSPDEIEADIDYTRARMDADLEALEDRLSPGHIIDEAMRQMRSGAASEYFHNLGETAKRNPMPLALITTGLAWLALSGRAGGGYYGGPGASVGEYGYEGAWQGEAERGESGGEATAEGIKAKAGQAWERTTGSAGAAVQSARERAHRMGESARHGMQTARERARRRAEQARQGARRATDFMYEQPLIAAGVALTVGALLGAALPTTRREHELMGRRSDELKQSVKREAESLLHEGEERLSSASRRGTDSPSSSQQSAPESREAYGQTYGESAATAGMGATGSLLPEEDLTIGEERGARVSPGASGERASDAGGVENAPTEPGGTARPRR